MNNKKYLIAGIVALVAFMTVGYAALAQELNIFGTAQIDASWDIQIAGDYVNVHETENGSVTEITNASENVVGLEFEVDLLVPGSEARYDIVITNHGTIDAELSNIDEVYSDDLPDVFFNLSGIAVGEKLPAGQTNTATLTVTWNELATEVPEGLSQETANITFTYDQDQ